MPFIVLLLSIIITQATAQSCGRVIGDQTAFCSTYFNTVGQYFSAGGVQQYDDSAASEIARLQSNHTLTSACIDHITVYFCSRFMPPCAPEGSDPVQRIRRVCASSCQALLEECPEVMETSYYIENMCSSDRANIADDPSMPCFDVIAQQIVNDDGEASTESDSRASSFIASVSTLAAIATLTI